MFGIRPARGQNLAGILALDEILWASECSGPSLFLGDRATRGHGWASEAMRLALWFAFDDLNLRRVQLTVFDYNARAIRPYERPKGMPGG